MRIDPVEKPKEETADVEGPGGILHPPPPLTGDQDSD